MNKIEYQTPIYRKGNGYNCSKGSKSAYLS